MSDPSEKSKLFVDEDWKTKVEAERAAARQSTDSPPEVAAEGQPSPEAPANAPSSADDPLANVKLPPASLGTLVEMLASQVTVHLGLYPDPLQKKPLVRLNLARHYIDTLAVLQEKTKGNVTVEEESLLEHVLHDLRMMFVAAGRK